jgi:uncharacterized protein with gpF-like domain
MPQKNKLKYRRGLAVRPPKQTEVKYRKQLLALIKQINDAIKAQVLPAIKQTRDLTIRDSVEVTDGFIGDITQAFATIQLMLNLGDEGDKAIGAQFVGITGAEVERRAIESASRAGIQISSLQSIVEQEQLNNALDAMTAENVDLIQGLGNDYLRKMQNAITENFLTGKFTGNGGLERELSRLSGVTKNRAKLIARDQTSKINGVLTQIRATNSGSIGYQWHNMKDSRVRGNPSGKYPNVPKTRNHWDREGKYYLWNPMKTPPIAPDGKPFRQPPVDGAPGQAINCRCYAAPIWVESSAP